MNTFNINGKKIAMTNETIGTMLNLLLDMNNKRGRREET